MVVAERAEAAAEVAAAFLRRVVLVAWRRPGRKVSSFYHLRR
jgi:hypothetical protein